MLTRRKVFATILSTVFLAAPPFLATAGKALAQYPDKPITVIVPNGAGGALDLYVRAVAKHLEKKLSQDVIVKNVTGAGTATGSREAYDAAPDGYTFLAHHQALFGIAAQGILGRPFEQMEPIARTGGTPIGLAVRPSAPLQDLDGLRDYLTKHPGKVRMGVFLTAHSHFTALRIGDRLGVDLKLINIPGGDAPLHAAMLGDHIDMRIIAPGTSRSYIEAGEYRPLVMMSDKRSRDLPDTTTVIEQGYPNLVNPISVFWYANSETPENIKTFMTDKLEETMKDPDFQKEMDRLTEDQRFARGEALKSEVYEDYASYVELAEKYDLVKD